MNTQQIASVIPTISRDISLAHVTPIAPCVLHLENERYVLQLASTTVEIEEAQRLRFRVFNLELSRGLEKSYQSGKDEDQFDDVCDHLIVTERHTGQVIGTYRLQTGLSAYRHYGYYSATEFNLSSLEDARREILELGRACVDEEHRNQAVIHLLWKGIARYARNYGARYLMGCSSIISQSIGGGLATYELLRKKHLVEARWRTEPLADKVCIGSLGEPLPVPKLMGAYLAIGAKICGKPALDRQFGTLVFLTWLDLDGVSSKVLKRYLS